MQKQELTTAVVDALTAGGVDISVSMVPRLVAILDRALAERHASSQSGALLAEDLAQLREQFGDLRARYEAVVSELEACGSPSEVDAPASKRRGRPRQSPPVEQPAPIVEPPADPIDRQALRVALVKLGNSVAVALLAQVGGARKFSDVAEDDLPRLAALVADAGKQAAA